MNKSELKRGYSIFGNKGAVWSNECHISKDNDRTGRTLCGVPMLSSNWARIEDVQEVGCKECLSLYSQSSVLEQQQIDLVLSVLAYIDIKAAEEALTYLNRADIDENTQRQFARKCITQYLENLPR